MMIQSKMFLLLEKVFSIFIFVFMGLMDHIVEDFIMVFLNLVIITLLLHHNLNFILLADVSKLINPFVQPLLIFINNHGVQDGMSGR